MGNLSEPFRASTPIANLEFWAAQSFITSSFDFDISSIDVIAGNGAMSPDIVAELRLATGPFGDIDTSAGGLVGTFLAPDVSGGLAVRTFLPNSPMTLMSSTKYWFILGANSGTYDWAYAENNMTYGPGMLDNYADSSDAGNSWNHHPETDNPYFIQVNGVSASAVPEPSSLVLLLTAVGCGALRNTIRGRWRALRTG